MATQNLISAISADRDGRLIKRAPILCIPTDVLRQVFALVCPSNEASVMLQSVALSRLPKTSFKGDIVFSQVCREWRQTALSSPMLWTTPIMDRGKELATTMIARAAPASVVIIWQPMPETIVSDIDMITTDPHTGYLTSLVITAPRQTLEYALNAVVVPSPTLRRVSLTRHSKDPEECLLNGITQVATEVPPHIEFFRTTGCFAQLPPQAWARLKTLIVDWKLSTPSHRLIFMHLPFAYLLESCPALEILHLRLRRWSLWNEDQMRDKHIMLDHLHTLLLSYDLAHICLIMSAFEAPKLQRLQLTNVDSHRNQPSQREVAEFLESLAPVHMTLNGVYRSVWLKLLQSHAEVHLNIGDLNDRDDSYSIGLSFQEYTPDLFTQALLSHWHIQWGSLRELQLNSWRDYNATDDIEDPNEYRYLSTRACSTFLTYLPKLERLHLVRKSSALIALSALLDHGDNDQPLCPSLRVLVLERITFAQRECQSEPEPALNTILDVVERWLVRSQERCEKKLPSLEFRNCDLLNGHESSSDTWTAYLGRWVDEVKFRKDCNFEGPA
jgi:hypothetical protein